MQLPLQTVGNTTAGVLALAGSAYELWLWRKRPHTRSHLWGGLLAVFTGAYAILHGLAYVLTQPGDVIAMSKAVTVCLMLMIFCTCEYAEALVGQTLPIKQPYRVAIILPLLSVITLTDWVIAGAPVLVPFWGGAVFSSLEFNPVYAALMLLCLLSVVGTVGWMVRRIDDRAERRLLAGAFAIWILAGLHDLIIFFGQVSAPAFFMEYGFVAIVAATQLLDVRSYARLLESTTEERRRWKREVTDQAEAILDLLAEAPLPILVHRRGRLTHVNRTAAEALRTTPASLIGTELLDWISPRAMVEARGKLITLEAPGQLAELTMLPAQGPSVHWQAKAFALRLSGENATVVIALDITSQRQLLAQTMGLDRMVATGTLAAGVAHEINNPLTFVMANLHHLRDTIPGGDPGSVELIDEALNGTQRVRDVVQDLRRLAQPHTSSDVIDLQEIVKAAARIIHNEARHHARLDVDVPSVTIEGDRAKLGQVFVNLLLNAIEAIPTGRREDHRVRIRAEVNDDDVRIEVVDSGEGIEPEHLSQIFDPFFTTKTLGKNSGLGLAIARETVVAAGGDLSIESRRGEGTTVVVRLLRARPVERARETVPPVVSALEVPKTVLLIDDEASVCRAIRRMIAHRYDVTTTVSAEEALTWIEDNEHSFDAVICDVMMPQRNGRDVHERIAELDPELARATVFITGGVFGDLEKWAGEVDNTVLTKPFDAKDLIDVLDGLFPGRANTAPPTSGVNTSSSEGSGGPSSSSMTG